MKPIKDFDRVFEILPGPRSPATKPLPIISITFRMISGADEPRAISVKFAYYGLKYIFQL